MGNLLARRKSFEWEDPNEDRNKFIEKLTIAVDEARKFGDQVYGPANLQDIQLSWGSFFYFLHSTWYDFDRFKEKFTWINETQYRSLLTLLQIFAPTTANGANDFESLALEFPDENNSLIGTRDETCGDPLVYDNDSWIKFHEDYVRTFDYKRQCKEYAYFDRFFKPDEILINQLNQEIYGGRGHVSFDRIDPALIPGEKIHIHFHHNENCALNIDGTWKHESASFDLKKEACEILAIWGFKLPVKYY